MQTMTKLTKLAFSIVCGEKSSCGDKKQYENFQQANIAAVNLSRKYNSSIVAYKCPWCSRYHTGNEVPELSMLLKIEKYVQLEKLKLLGAFAKRLRDLGYEVTLDGNKLRASKGTVAIAVKKFKVFVSINDVHVIEKQPLDQVVLDTILEYEV